jgi:glycine/D-amino acid oxidase-like deaminating enzyme/nitrite reductase/ring-hydroxylating ferredoxin subunit
MKRSNPEPGTASHGVHTTCWMENTLPLTYTSLQAPMETSIVVIGGGIAGLSVAYCLTKAGHEVVVLEDGNIGAGETGHTTAHLVNAIDDRYFEIEKLFGQKTSRQVAESHTAAINFIEDTIQLENIDCEFLRVNGHLFLHDSDKIKTLEDEFVATHRAGIDTTMIRDVPGLAAQRGPCLRFPDQAQFHPIKYIHGLCRAIVENHGRIFTQTHVSKISSDGVVANGFEVKADHIVVATNTPINDIVTMHTKQFAYRTYVIAARIPKGVLQPALWWDTGDQQSTWITKPYHYARLQSYTDTHDLLICGGEDHKTGQAGKENISEEERYIILEHWARKHFPFIEGIDFKWSGQVMEPLDGLAFIGKNPGNDNIYIATGDSGNGMTHGTIAGMLISDLIMGYSNPWEEVYDPSRVTFKVTGDYLKEAGSMAAQYLDFLTPGDLSSIADIRNDDGAIIRSGIKKVAVYKDPQGHVSAFSASCPHLGCNVRWNADEKSFDCPCHGSRFSCTGKVLNGPALTDLKPVDIMEESLKEKQE